MKRSVVNNILPRKNSNQVMFYKLSKLINEEVDYDTNLQKWQLEKNSTLPLYSFVPLILKFKVSRSLYSRQWSPILI
jgi:hypothetical protein